MLFRSGATAKGYEQRLAEQVFDLIEPFAGYAFNKAHAFSYAVIAYQTAYLKAHYPVEYMTAVLISAGAHPTGAQERIAAADKEGFWSGLGTAAKEYITDPRLLASGVAETLPSLIGTGGIGGLTGAGAKRILGKELAEPFRDGSVLLDGHEAVDGHGVPPGGMGASVIGLRAGHPLRMSACTPSVAGRSPQQFLVVSARSAARRSEGQERRLGQEPHRCLCSCQARKRRPFACAARRER